VLCCERSGLPCVARDAQVLRVLVLATGQWSEQGSADRHARTDLGINDDEPQGRDRRGAAHERAEDDADPVHG